MSAVQSATALRSVFSQKGVFSLNWIPNNILYREEQISALTRILQDIFRGLNPHNSLLVGDYGTGKTLVARSVAEQLEKQALESKVKLETIYINCNDCDTHTQILRGILNQVDSLKGRSGFPTDQYQIWIQEYAASKDRVFLLLDEIDRTIYNKEGRAERLLYFLTRTIPNLSIIMLTNKVGLDTWLNRNLESRVRDTLRHQVIQFPDYAKGELINILKDRCEIGLAKSAYNIETIVRIADLSYRNGLRARGLIDLTRTAGELADQSDADFLEDRFIDMAVETIVNRQNTAILENLDPPSRLILYLVAQSGSESIDADQVYRRYLTECSTRLGIGGSRGMFCTYVKRLEDLDLLLQTINGRGRGRGVVQELQLHPHTSEDVRAFHSSLLGQDTPHPSIKNVTGNP